MPRRHAFATPLRGCVHKQEREATCTELEAAAKHCHAAHGWARRGLFTSHPTQLAPLRLACSPVHGHHLCMCRSAVRCMRSCRQ